uniref:60S ribosomal protein L13 n=1 Tax=Odontella aurita TaxID=265563 RepID=A0A6U6DYD2_9STRA|mmetsp:Transcript_22856/g.67467  ORF Transcript_22856/g.67467 Transcript_22856/m.67467 type:complete len:211 (+) Transcript_22856:656-1288(+)|eukprot:CAMPEP_0113544518 /NCGR_PEP_ID=MMETSP0015_2-20120614/10753_1 /TAXON_ID=2838 /ORGANISM="Odontella" /LENGTH=210 /DNA_ID=CAMNT_0000444787 /DNA_START=657 /DNA_END=1289 /DNA_ORIENTATION=+ /assembly_acc=CAM_ASM_000160
MVKHNNVLPNLHFHKKYLESSRGPLKVRLNLDQAGKKKSRRLARAAKAAAIAPRPLQKLRPTVRCQTQKYSAKSRLGRGFTLQELKLAGFTPSYARTVGICVDPRRTNKSVDTRDANVERLKEYKAKLVVFPRKRLNKPKAGDSGPEETKAATQLSGTVLPLAKPSSEIVMEEVTDEMKEFKAFTTMRNARKESRVVGHRISVKNRKDKK